MIFSTKDRHSWLDANVRPRMHAYLSTVCGDAGAEAFRVGGVADHVHLVTTLPRTPLPGGHEGLKKKSSKWIFGEPESNLARLSRPFSARSRRSIFWVVAPGW